jgi:amino acid transporter
MYHFLYIHPSRREGQQAHMPSTVTDISKDKFHIDRELIKKISIGPLLALIGLGADSISSCCYGPESAFLVVQNYPTLSVFVCLLSILTIWLLTASYSQVIELFPNGGGGYVVASKLLSPFFGLVSGCALLIDYVLTITISVASGIDALFSFLSKEHLLVKEEVKILIIVGMILINLRGVKESITPWIPIFILFNLTHFFGFFWGIIQHDSSTSQLTSQLAHEITQAESSMGIGGLLFLIFKAYGMGAGTYTGIEAVSNNTRIIAEPRVQNAKRTMTYMALGLSLTVIGLFLGYVMYEVKPVPGKTLNAVLFGQIYSTFSPTTAQILLGLTLFSETVLLIMAAQTGFLGGPRVLTNMSIDRWFPNRFTTLSDRFVIRDGIIIMGIASILLMLFTKGAVPILVILYSLSVFITFTLSQIGMTLYWIRARGREKNWLRKALINSVGGILSLVILITLSIIKFEEGAWVTLTCVTALIVVALIIKRYYSFFAEKLAKMHADPIPKALPKPENLENRTTQHTAVLFFSGAGPTGQYAINKVVDLFGDSINHFVILQAGVVDTQSFKGPGAVDVLRAHIKNDVAHLVNKLVRHGYSAEGMISIGIDITDELEKLAEVVHAKHPSCVFFGGRLILPKETSLSRWMHNQTLNSISRRLFHKQYNFITIPIYVD